LDSEVKPQIAAKLIKKLNSTDIMLSESQIEKKVISVLSSSFPVAGPLRLKKDGPVIVAFVGPTGSGKTTTLAKLAAHCCINKNKNVSIITADTYRIAAIEQIRMFAEIVKVGLQVIFSPDEVAGALEACSNDDIVFVDTAGRSQRNSEHMEELQEFLQQLGADEIHLVLSAATKDSDLAEIISRYKAININRLIFTKLDETVKIGNIFNSVSEAEIPVSYFTFGQSVPDDIELAQTTRFVQRLWEGKAL
ncbi:MAG: 50S ribosome-binding GTPase, partial [Fibrobacter sp.]|nr:50S ribosome-binding GTPase [Fibrobacter sp.]